MRMRAFTLALAAACWAFTAAADPPGAAVHKFAIGDYLAAADIADDRATADNLAFAARALLAACVTSGDAETRERLLDRAEQTARQALALDDGSVEARLNLALVYGMRSKQMGVGEAFAHRYAPRGRTLITEALALAPHDARAHALLGAWHLEVLRRGGRAGAIIYGARFEVGVAAFERARALSPDDPMIALHFGVALLQLDANRHAAAAETQLRAAAALPATDAFSAFAATAANDILAVLRAAGPEAAAAHALARGL